MCGRYTETAAFEELARRFGIEIEDGDNEEMIARYNVAPSQPVPIVVAPDGRRRLVTARWGLRPLWVRDGRLAPINARAESVATSPMFRDALQRTRCLIPADGFYEWQAVAGRKRKQPWYLRLRGGGLFAFAGLYTPPRREAAIPATCTIITTTPNELAAPLHDRMPVILDPEAEAAWLDRHIVDAAALRPLLRPLPAERMEAYPVASLVSSAQNDGPALIERAPA
ncbi:MAG TPA: SOS response-associated peptidase [Methylomirabilota bacterium]|nr:SOS response-associated peptidase [Methylomirabilota bacterium]